MGKAPAPAADSVAGNLRTIPSVDRILSKPEFVTLASEFGRERVKSAVVEHLNDVRNARRAYQEEEAVTAVGERIVAATSSTLRRVINATGVIIHTNLGRSPI